MGLFPVSLPPTSPAQAHPRGLRPVLRALCSALHVPERPLRRTGGGGGNDTRAPSTLSATQPTVRSERRLRPPCQSAAGRAKTRNSCEVLVPAVKTTRRQRNLLPPTRRAAGFRLWPSPAAPHVDRLQGSGGRCAPEALRPRRGHLHVQDGAVSPPGLCPQGSHDLYWTTSKPVLSATGDTARPQGQRRCRPETPTRDTPGNGAPSAPTRPARRGVPARHSRRRTVWLRGRA